jgi:valyl-tRNA synthetase
VNSIGGYDPSEAEPRTIERWLLSGIGSPEVAGAPSENFAVALPPPNVTGALHMGHALNGSLQDVLVRLHRMRGHRTNWIFGTDHAGIATQRLVEKHLARQGITPQDLGREAFVSRVWDWREEYGGQIVRQFKRIGASLDYAHEHFTLDDGYQRAVRKTFVELFHEGLIYRDRYLVNWDPGLRSAISDLEVEQREGVVDTMYSIGYPMADGDGEVVVATVRPETMLGDAAVAVNPDDSRYAHLVGREVVLPLTGRRVPIIAEAGVDKTFGTGALKVTPAHDPLDFEIGRRRGLPEIGVIGEDGCMTQAAGARYAGRTVTAAQDLVVADLETAGALRGTWRITHTVPFSQRSGERVQPLVSLQWFMRMETLAPPAIDAVASGSVRIHPASERRRFLAWMQDIRPWCVSRQLWWGHQIPVWHRGDETYCGMTAPEGTGWEQDPDVLDTWFSSAMWPYATLGWPETTPDLAAFYPTAVLSTARDILFLWVARMIMFGLRFMDDVPFRDVYVHSIIQAPDGRRMSKSLGTGIDPVDLIAGGPRPEVFKQGGEFPAYGADALRFGLLMMSSTQDVRFSEEKIRQGRALVNKLFNAARLIESHAADEPAAPRPQLAEDRWILSRLEVLKAQLLAALGAFEFARAASLLAAFVHHDLCDWYLELVKPRLDGHSVDDGRRALMSTLMFVLRETLAVAHPVVPFVTEELWARIGWAATDGLLAGSSWPEAHEQQLDPDAEAEVARAIAAAQVLRTWRHAVGVSPRMTLTASADVHGEAGLLARVLALARVQIVAAQPVDAVATVAVPGGAVVVAACDGVRADDVAEMDRKQRNHLTTEISRAVRQLDNPRFVDNADPDLVEAERLKLARLQLELVAIGGAA